MAWTLRLAGGPAEQVVDMGAGGVAGIEVTGATGRLVLRLPRPEGTVSISVQGPVGELIVRTPTGTPVRLRLRGGATTAAVDGRASRAGQSGRHAGPGLLVHAR
ncbi:hypothetical protein [Actinoplanes nipponensis]|uniref:hypothetical protein n=1 Tax=Actinoplanes nipponensis TaxID=135950 RepID=UPI0031E7DBDB